MKTIPELQAAFEKQGYICQEDLVVTVYLALKLGKPLLVEGAPGVGKTEIAKVLSQVFGTDLIRLQCYEGLDENKALYEWNYQRQLLKIQIMKDNASADDIEKDLFDSEYLLERPLLKSITADKQVILLIDEVDKTDEAFEAFLFEILSDFQVSIPELGTIRARNIPITILTSNGERELSDALKRRCLYLYIDYPDVEKEIRILKSKVPEADELLVWQVAKAVNLIRNNPELRKLPSIAETIDWARALVALNLDSLTVENVNLTLNTLLKNRDDYQILTRNNGIQIILEALAT